jgi:hypothetical protein
MKAKQLAVNTFAALAVAALMATALAHAGEHKGEHPDASPGLVHDVREATQNFHDVTAAMAAGYVSAGSCASGPNEGAMGVHYVNAAFVDDGVLDVQRPEVLVYEPRDGGLRLVAVEFFVIAEQWDAANTGAPVLGGQLFNYVGGPQPPSPTAALRAARLGVEEKSERHLQRLEPEGVVRGVHGRGGRPRLGTLDARPPTPTRNSAGNGGRPMGSEKRCARHEHTDSRPARVECAGIQLKHEREKHYATNNTMFIVLVIAWQLEAPGEGAAVLAKKNTDPLPVFVST